MARYLYSELSAVVEARLNLLTKADTREWITRHEETIDQLCRDFMPHGSGFDSGTKLDLDASHAEKLVFTTSFHHMDEGGGYDGWTEHAVTVTPSFRGVNIRVGGRNRNQIKEYIYEAFDTALRTEIEWDKDAERWYSPELRQAAKEWQEKVAKGEIA